MKIITASATIIEDELAKLTLPERIERCGRICYKSEDKIKPGSAEPFCEKVIKRGHSSVLEMAVCTLIVKATRSEIADLLLMYPLFEEMKYLKVSFQWETHLFVGVLVTGSVRTFRDLHRVTGGQSWIIEQCYNRLSATNSSPLFADEDSVSSLADFFPNCKTVGSIVIKARTSKDFNNNGKVVSREIFSKHKHVAVKFIVNRAVSHELVRHRTCSFLQESQRYVKINDMEFIGPVFFGDESRYRLEWERSMSSAASDYSDNIFYGQPPQEARLVLPNSTKTELIVYTNLDEWGHIFDQRDSKAADPSMREVMGPLHEEFRKRWPDVFGESKEGKQEGSHE